jgi:hypothetical protein
MQKIWYDVVFDADYNQDPRNLGARKFATVGMVDDWHIADIVKHYADQFTSEQEAETSPREEYLMAH